ncbi:hypothetical protein PPYR_00814 [Photinus pyralis]|uniref:RNA polymerase II-associated protein 3 n=1 Tax=Photinus pyralis TaxID=7054 RepID=A0A5N4ACJ3_PHOPY|nr:RNA polymerase II-associated protein 3-like [Photinus pyralis]XP_031350176.1 RNA polymerase II-associated protein 3-like [Photinus pyralis]KAB0795031.1 hypothetical protein PPYR_11870 [Photinus pyralis]KAB0803844.1 hypothetical protein PPYR_00814 [Photinus pyralis]
MMDPITLQKQIRDNSTDLANFCSDLKQWGEEMKNKDEALKCDTAPDDQLLAANKSKTKKIELLESNAEKPKKKTKKRIKASDYAAWEKFDVDAECAKLDVSEKDNDLDGDLTDEYDEDSHDQAVYEKEKGNNFVKHHKWDQAILCYTKAIECYAYDPIFYANRALCYLKKENYKLAETDCTSALRLDKSYVKAYQRRAAAREALNQLTEAHDDLLKVFDYEPNNKESKTALSKLEKKLENVNKKPIIKLSTDLRPKSKFTISQQKKHSSTVAGVENTSAANKPTTVQTYWSGEDDIELIEAINKPPHLRSKKPLRRITIQDVDDVTDKDTNSPLPWPRPGNDSTLIKCDDLKVVERKLAQPHQVETQKAKVDDKVSISSEFNMSVPLTSIQFTSDWRQLEKCKELQYQYLKQINPDKIPSLFKESLDCDIFSGIIHTLAEMFVENGDKSVYLYLLKLSEVKRFSMLSMFMGDSDKKDLIKLAEYMRATGVDRANQLMSKYGL